MDFLETEHIEHKTDHTHQRKMVRFWKCSKVSLHSSKTYPPGDTEQEGDQTCYQWTKMQNLPGWWVKKVWHSFDGWLLVAKKEEYTLLIHDTVAPVDQRNLVEETLSSEGSRLDNQRQSLGSTMARQALQHFFFIFPKMPYTLVKDPVHLVDMLPLLPIWLSLLKPMLLRLALVTLPLLLRVVMSKLICLRHFD